MSQVKTESDRYSPEKAASDRIGGRNTPDAASPPQSWLDSLRVDALTRFILTGFPDRTSEEWRFTSIDPIANTKFSIAAATENTRNIHILARHTLRRDALSELVFVNGRYAPWLSIGGKLPRGVKVLSLPDAMNAHSAEIQQHLARTANPVVNPFIALNTGFFRDGAYIHVPRGVTLTDPIHLVFISTPQERTLLNSPRVLIVLEDGAAATVVERFIGEGPGVYFNNTVTEIVAGEESRLEYCKLLQESNDAFHIGTTQVSLARAAECSSHSVTLAGKLVRNDLNVTLAGRGASATLNGLVLLDGERHCDNHTVLDHAVPDCHSLELYKHVLRDQSTGVFKGKILVRNPAQKTDARQTSKTLLLDDGATMNSMPALEIYADDVKCTHGCTTGPVDHDQVFYLRSRGVPEEASRHLLTYAFAADMTRRIHIDPIRAYVENHIAAQHGLPLDVQISGNVMGAA